MKTPDVTITDVAGSAGGIAALVLALDASSVAVQMAGVIGITIVSIALIAADSYRRGKRAEYNPEIHEA